MFGKNRTALAPHGENAPSIKPKKASGQSMEEKHFTPKKPGNKLPDKILIDGVMYQRNVTGQTIKSNGTRQTNTNKPSDIELKLNIDTTEVQSSLRMINNAMKHAGVLPTEKQPRLRIDINDIADMPKVFVDGVEQQELCRIDLGWNTGSTVDSRYSIDFMDGFGRLHRIGQAK
ncbi:hypothetical protein QMG96_05995 [Lactiplantibacillus plantarum]|uniref:hypothetical protein n=1 Tax=Lactiplantibacillus plantarum TaxID=1590 RepID=UPI0015DC91FA|nr:hypothetical protein [Lactiplantibacillus plantarum]QLK66753.1 hypothetical protein LACP0422_15350 [Lactiplantibacillus plantarum]WKE63379.1 hypothetical protein QMG96_05995 [Lactiplantibacillus plantarum]WOD60562.1 hypothetical protein NXS20_05960 [Lactiplantibacillus plantarum]WQH17776.1 hypothetical protein T1I15_10330 [Lactiplantibacillus plantarum]